MSSTLRDDWRAGFTFFPADWNAAEEVKAVSLAARGLWIGIICLMARSPKFGKLLKPDGKIPDGNWIAKQLTCEPLEVPPLLEELGREQVYSIDDGAITCRRMYRRVALGEVRADSGFEGAKARWQGHGKKKGQKDGKGMATVGKERKGGCSLTQKESVVIDEWNALGRPFPRVLRIGARKVHLKNRLADPWWCENWQTALAKMKDIPGCRGQNDRGWVADIDFFLRPDTVARILEGKYDQWGTKQPRGGRGSLEELSYARKGESTVI